MRMIIKIRMLLGLPSNPDEYKYLSERPANQLTNRPTDQPTSAYWAFFDIEPHTSSNLLFSVLLLLLVVVVVAFCYTTNTALHSWRWRRSIPAQSQAKATSFETKPIFLSLNTKEHQIRSDPIPFYTFGLPLLARWPLFYSIYLSAQ